MYSSTIAMLNIEPNFSDPDAFYQALVDMHRDLATQDSHTVNARLILLLANHIGDMNVLQDAMNRARKINAGDVA
jgi:hypothetical protein